MPAGMNAYPGDSVDFELRMIKKLVGETKLKLALKTFGLQMPETRENLDQLIEGLLGRLL